MEVIKGFFSGLEGDVILNSLLDHKNGNKNRDSFCG
jgi:hypothetical protein